MSVTDEDRAKATTVADALSELLDDMSGLYPAGVEVIAAALAAEREKARAPFLAVADELDGWKENAERYAEHSRKDAVTAAMARARVQAYRRAIENIRLAAQDQP